MPVRFRIKVQEMRSHWRVSTPNIAYVRSVPQSREPRFVPRQGQKDFTSVRCAPVLNCIVYHERRILLVHRSATLRFYPGFWNGISGFLDDGSSVVQKAKAELLEEVGIGPSEILSIEEGAVFTQEELHYQKTWIVHPVLVQVATTRISFNWEAQAFRWVSVPSARRLKLLPGFDRVLATFFDAKGKRRIFFRTRS